MAKTPPPTTQTENPEDERPEGVPVEGEPEFLDDGFPNPKAMDVWDYQMALTPDQWRDHSAYLYRTHPRLVRVPGEETNIEKQSSPLTMEDVRENHGGGGYTIKLKRKRKMLFDARFALDGEPKLKEGQTLANESAPAAGVAEASAGTPLAEKIIDYLKDELKQARAEGREANPAAALKQVAESSAELMSLGAQKSIEMVVASMPKQSSLEDTIKMFSEISKLQTPQEGGGLAGAITLLDQLGLLKKQADSDPLDQIEKVMNVAERLGFNKSGSGDSPWNELIRTLGPQAGAIVSNVSTILENAVSLSANNLQRIAIEKGVQASPRPPKPSPPIAPALPPAESEEPPAPASSHPDSAGSPQEVLATKYKEKIMEFLEGDRTGGELADWLYDADRTFSTQLATVLQHNPQELAGDPILVRATSHPRVREFAREYVERHLQIILEEKEAAEEPAPEPAA